MVTCTSPFGWNSWSLASIWGVANCMDASWIVCLSGVWMRGLRWSLHTRLDGLHILRFQQLTGKVLILPVHAAQVDPRDGGTPVCVEDLWFAKDLVVDVIGQHVEEHDLEVVVREIVSEMMDIVLPLLEGVGKLVHAGALGSWSIWIGPPSVPGCRIRGNC